MREALVRVARMHGALLADECQQALGPRSPSVGPGGHDPARVHQRVDIGRHVAVVDEEVFLDPERRVVPLEIAGAVVDDPMPQRQVLGPGGRPDRIGLNESELLQCLLQRGGGEQAAGDSEPPQLVETDGHGAIVAHGAIDLPA